MARPWVLNTTDLRIRIYLDDAVETTQLVVNASFVDIDDDGTPGTQVQQTNGTTPTTIVPPPASGIQRVVTELTIFNADTATANITLLNYDGFSTDEFYYFALPPGKTWNLSGAGALIPQRQSDAYILDEVVDYTTTVQNWQDVDGTNLNLTIATSGGDVLIGFDCLIKNNTANTYTGVDVLVSSVGLLGGDDGIQVIKTEVSQDQGPLSFTRLVQGLQAGVFSFKLQWKVSGGTSTMYAGSGITDRDVHPQFWVKDIG